MIGYIYSLSNEGGIYYVGSTWDVNQREKTHRWYSNGNICIFEVLEVGEFHNTEELVNVENQWIEQMRQWGFPITNTKGVIGKDDKASPSYKKPKQISASFSGELIDRVKKIQVARGVETFSKMIAILTQEAADTEIRLIQSNSIGKKVSG